MKRTVADRIEQDKNALGGEVIRVVFLAHPPRGRDGLARGSSPRLEWRAIPYGYGGGANASGFVALERLLAASSRVISSIPRQHDAETQKEPWETEAFSVTVRVPL
jgi:hypothetical protein